MFQQQQLRTKQKNLPLTTNFASPFSTTLDP